MKTFDDYCKEHFKVDDDGNVCSIRKGCFNGNGLLQRICFDDLERLWDFKNKEIAELKTDNNRLEMILKEQTALAKEYFEENKKLRECVEFYADKGSWGIFRFANYSTISHRDVEDCSSHISGEHRSFGGKRARAVLKEISDNG